MIWRGKQKEKIITPEYKVRPHFSIGRNINNQGCGTKPTIKTKHPPIPDALLLLLVDDFLSRGWVNAAGPVLFSRLGEFMLLLEPPVEPNTPLRCTEDAEERFKLFGGCCCESGDRSTLKKLKLL